MTKHGARSRRPAVRVLLAAVAAMTLAVMGLPAASASAVTAGTATLGLDSQITVTSSANPAPPSTDVTLTARFAVVNGNADVAPTGNVGFLDDGAPLATETLSGGQTATWTGQLAPGTHSITVSYDGDGTYTPKTSSPLSLIVRDIPDLSIAPTWGSTTLPTDGSASDAINIGTVSDVTNSGFPNNRLGLDLSGIAGMTAAELHVQRSVEGVWTDLALTDLGSGHLSAQLDVTADAAVAIQSNTLPADSPLAILRLAVSKASPAGTLTMVVSLLGSTDGVTWSSALAQGTQLLTVLPSSVTTTTTTAVTASNTLTDDKAAPVKITADVTPSAATGTVTFLDNGESVGAASLSNGTATYTPVLALGYHTISATYAGDPNYATSTGTQAQQISVLPPGGSLHAIVPVRILDTRNGTGAPKGQLAAGKTLKLQVAGSGGIPASGVLGMSANITVVQPVAAGSVTLYPTGGKVTGTVNIDFPKVVNTSGLVITNISAAGQVSIVNGSSGPLQLILDVSGWFAQQDGSVDAQGRYNPVAPLRLLDTRFGTGVAKGQIKPGRTLMMKVAGTGAIPKTGVGAAMLNVTIVKPDLSVYLTLYPSGIALPHVSTDAFQKGEVRAARVIVGVGADGYVKIFSPYATADVVVDIVGWFSSASSTAALGSTFVPLAASQRLLPSETAGTSLWKAAQSKRIAIAGVHGIPKSDAAIHPLAVIANLHVTAPVTGGYLAAYPADPRATGSDLNFIAHQTVQNLGVVKLADTGAFNLFSTAQANVTIDVYGWFG